MKSLEIRESNRRKKARFPSVMSRRSGSVGCGKSAEVDHFQSLGQHVRLHQTAHESLNGSLADGKGLVLRNVPLESMRIAAVLEGMTSASLGAGTPYAPRGEVADVNLQLSAAWWLLLYKTEQVKRLRSMITESDLPALDELGARVGLWHVKNVVSKAWPRCAVVEAVCLGLTVGGYLRYKVVRRIIESMSDLQFLTCIS